tara:strand:- start:415 stop:1287 length:873 start_codon:yes stop_codon:yes gene_type:complete
MKNIALFIIINISGLSGQFSYPAEDFLGGGIGYSPMYIKLKEIPGADALTNVGLDPTQFSDPFVIHGGEGFAHVTGRWRIGSYAGMGGSSVSTIPLIKWYIDDDPNNNNGNKGYSGENLNNYTGVYDPSITAKLKFLLGAATIEYVMPLLQDLELSSGALFGLGRVGLSLEQKSGENIGWGDAFSNVYGEFVDGALYYSVDNSFEENDPITPLPVPGLLREVGATFFNFQPYIAVKFQFLERFGLRISVGYNKGTVRQGGWKLNGITEISDSPQSTLEGISFRTMGYIGL